MRVPKLILILSAGLIGCFETACGDSSPQTLAAYSASLKAEFPDVATISTQDLSTRKDSPLLLDVREESEFTVSHLPGALRAEKDVIAQLRQLGANKETSLVVYCSVGYRSALMARKLQKAGFTNVRNLEGSIFAWANEGRSLVNADGPTTGVHPFSYKWGRYLVKSRWQWTSPVPAQK